MSHCKDCKHWNPDGVEDDDQAKGFGLCELASSDDGEPEYADAIFCAHDAEGYMAWLQTKGEFGCVQFEQAEAPDPVQWVREAEVNGMIYDVTRIDD